MSLPNELIGALPLPPGTRLTQVGLVGLGPMTIGGYSPGTPEEVNRVMEAQLRHAAFEVDGARFASANLIGRWSLGELGGCREAVALTIEVARR